ncbi:uncharacterized protein C3orf20-like isoform X2 [Perognathus longimembris pacificus]|uniref:uncharacterized protein C3orf20-like isoform X2 n=1 Tax=Perognathus longimembris pacificus TaxID=214514 RepID=UPI002018F4E2|nr:uncharacterized protein C3orf20-like isoform X2 [Perognathus longimembris pacificus]
METPDWGWGWCGGTRSGNRFVHPTPTQRTDVPGCSRREAVVPVRTGFWRRPSGAEDGSVVLGAGVQARAVACVGAELWQHQGHQLGDPRVPDTELSDEDLAWSLGNTSHKKEKSKEQKNARVVTVVLTEENDEPHSLGFSESPSVLNLSSNPKGSKMHWQKSLFEEYKLTAPEILYELGKSLQTHAEYKMSIPVGIVNLMNCSWQDLIENTYKCVSTPTTLKQDKALQGDSSSNTIIDSNNLKVNNNPKEEFHKENHLVKVKRPHIEPNKSLGKMSFVSNSQSSQMCQESNFSAVIHFSLSSKICLENGWISHRPYSKLEILQWKTLLSAAVKRLQVAIIQIKSEEAKLKREGFNKQLILRHYNDPEQEEIESSPQSSQSFFWLELLEKRPQMPTVREPDPEKRKFHYALVDGSSLIYYPSGRLAVCQSYSDLPWGGMYTNIFSDLPDPVILGTFTPFGCGSISFPNRKIIAMMFNQNGGMVTSRNGYIIREWMWPSKGKLEVPVEVGVNNFITVKISGRFAITLVYRWHPKSLKLSLAPVKHKSLPVCLADMPTGSADQLITSTIDSSMDISPMHDLVTSIKLRRLQRKAKHIFAHWLNYYRFSLGMELINLCKTPELPQKVIIKRKDPLTTVPLKQDINESFENKEYLQSRYTFRPLKNVFKLSAPCRIQRALAINQTSRFSLPNESKDSWFGSLLICPVVLRQLLCGKEENTCRCSPCSIPEVTDLEYDNLISNQLACTDQIIIVYVFSAKENDKHIEEVTKVYRELNRSRTNPCTKSHLDPFRLLKYNIMSATRFTGSDCPLLVQRHNITPGIFLMYIQGKLVFANFIFNGYSTSAKDLQKQIVKTKNDYRMGYFLPKDYRIGA